MSPMMLSLLRDIVNEIPNLNSGETFILQDLVRGYVWKRISASENHEKKTLGTMFKSPMHNPYLNQIVNIGKKDPDDSTSPTMYKKL